MPRLTYDLQFMRESAASLRLSLHTVEAKSQSTSSLDALNHHSAFSPSTENAPDGHGDKPDEETLAVLERLTYLDKVKTGMESTLAVLQEAESWSSLESEFTSLLADGLYSKAASRLSEASKSVSVFTHNTTEYESRRSLLLSLQNQLETSLVANLVKAINEKDKDACKSFFGIFGMIQREGEFRGYYYGSRRGPVVESWDKARLSDCGESSRNGGEGTLDLDMVKSSSQDSAQSPSTGPAIPFNTFLPQFYAALVNLVSEERALLPAIFPDPQPTLSTFLISIFDAIAPSLPQRLESMVEFQGATALTELIKAFKATEELAVGVQSTMDKLGFSTSVFAASPAVASPGALPASNGASPSAAAPSAEEVKSSRRDSRRFSRRLTAFSISVPRIESLDSNSGASGGPWENALFEPFLDFQSEYAALESRLLASQLDREIGSSRSAFGGAEGEDSARIVWERSIAVLGMAEGALERCLAFTHGYGAVGLVGAINEVIGSFLKRCGVLFEEKAAKDKKGGAGRSERNDFDDVDDLDLDSMDYSSEDWGTFQLALHLLGTCRAIQDRLASFESKLLLSLHQVAQGFLASRDEPSGLFVSGTTRGAISLLQQSALNSKDLHDLLEHLSAHTTASASHLKAPSFFPPTPISTAHAPHTFGQPPSVATSLMPQLLDPSRKSLTEFTISTQLFLQRTILSPLHTLLSTYPSLPIWTQPTPVPSKKSNALVVPTFSLDPSQIISRIGEGLLNLPRLFEVSVKDDALAFSIETLPFIDLEALRELREDSQAEANGPPPPVDPVSRARAGSTTLSTSTAPMISPSNISPLSSPQPNHSHSSVAAPTSGPAAPLSPETITSLHLSSLTLSLLSHLTTTVLPSLPTPLSTQGAAQLASDLGYLVNVVRALDVDWAEGEEWREGMECKEVEDWRKRVKEGGSGTGVWEKVRGMRGWKE